MLGGSIYHNAHESLTDLTSEQHCDHEKPYGVGVMLDHSENKNECVTEKLTIRSFRKASSQPNHVEISHFRSKKPLDGIRRKFEVG